MSDPRGRRSGILIGILATDNILRLQRRRRRRLRSRSFVVIQGRSLRRRRRDHLLALERAAAAAAVTSLFLSPLWAEFNSGKNYRTGRGPTHGMSPTCSGFLTCPHPHLLATPCLLILHIPTYVKNSHDCHFIVASVGFLYAGCQRIRKSDVFDADVIYDWPLISLLRAPFLRNYP